jgi:hypothetical protein
MHPYGDNFIPVIPLEDEMLHTQASPFCADPSCLCHEDQELLTIVSEQVTNGLFTPEEAIRFVEGKQL